MDLLLPLFLVSLLINPLISTFQTLCNLTSHHHHNHCAGSVTWAHQGQCHLGRAAILRSADFSGQIHRAEQRPCWKSGPPQLQRWGGGALAGPQERWGFQSQPSCSTFPAGWWADQLPIQPHPGGLLSASSRPHGSVSKRPSLLYKLCLFRGKGDYQGPSRKWGFLAVKDQCPLPCAQDCP